MNECLKCNSKNTVAVEYDHTNPEHYDGVSEYMCLDCGFRVGRWTGYVLRKGQYEKASARFNPTKVKLREETN